MKLQPLQDRVVIKRLDADEKTPGGLIIPAVAQEKPQQGTVIAVGPGVYAKDGSRRPVGVSVGARVLFEKYQGHEVGDGDERFVVIAESSILAVVEP